jgi:UDP-N-acetylglucosamine 1-carboxyvinyltransferase
MPKFIVQGGHTLRGTIRPAGNKNAALPCIAATLLTEDEVILENVPSIRDVKTLLELLKMIGAEVEWLDRNTIRVQARDLRAAEIEVEAAARIRASILLAGPMLARVGRMFLPPPGGDVIGRRRVDTHFLALSKLGAHVETAGGYRLETSGLKGADMFLDEPSVTATENAIMAAVMAKGQTRIRNAAAEPHVQDLCNMLIGMGAKISGVGTGTLEFEGVERLHGTRFRIGSDHIEVGSFHRAGRGDPR